MPSFTMGHVYLLLTFLVGVVCHEAAHAYCADRLGDPTPRRQGRCTLMPHRHLDLIGALALLFGGFGWGRPVAIRPDLMRGNPRLGAALTTLAGPLANLLVAALFAAGLKLGVLPSTLGMSPAGGDIVGLVIRVNVMLAVFNLLPIPPLDGFNFLVGLLPKDLSEPLEKQRPHGVLLLLLLILPASPNPVNLQLEQIILSVMGWLLR